MHKYENSFLCPAVMSFSGLSEANKPLRQQDFRMRPGGISYFFKE
jgi:hypothetical protein